MYGCVAGQALQGRRLEDLSVTELSQILSDVETLVRDLSEELVQDLGVRDELEFEKVARAAPFGLREIPLLNKSQWQGTLARNRKCTGKKGRSYWSAGNFFVI
jgi:hypothetical protein